MVSVARLLIIQTTSVKVFVGSLAMPKKGLFWPLKANCVALQYCMRLIPKSAISQMFKNRF